nr:thioesterase domain-containing protein [Planktothrix sp. FACHB-1355]
MRLFCFPFAGGNSFTYRTWRHNLPNWINVCPVFLPGRANRINEPAFTDLHELTATIFENIRDYVDLPFAVFGYSMGAIIGFELCRLLQGAGFNAEHLFVAASPPPPLTGRDPVIYDLPVENFKEELLKFNGTPKEILENEELFDLMLPLLRADFELVETYEYRAGSKLKCPIFAFGGSWDDEVSEEELKQWQSQTDSEFDWAILEGNHFFINSCADEILARVSDAISARHRI